MLPHHIHYDDLYNAVLSDIRECIRLTLEDEQAVVDRLVKATAKQTAKEQAATRNKLSAHEKRQHELQTIFSKLYEDNVLSNLDGMTYNHLSAKYKKEMQDIAA